MEVIFDGDKKPLGVFLPLDEWEILKPGVNETSDLYKLMDGFIKPDIFDMDAGQFSAYLAPLAQETVQQALDNGLYFSYPAAAKELSGTFVHEYKNGKKEMVEIDKQTGKEHFIRYL
jgi:hypothetical protein